MKKLIALILSLVMVACIFAGCTESKDNGADAPANSGDNSTATPTNPADSGTATPTDPAPTEPAATEPVADNVSIITSISAHDNGWKQMDFNGNTEAQGVYFNTKANDAPYNEDWSLRYYPADTECMVLVRDGEEIDVTAIGADSLVKFGKTAYYIVLDKWLIGEQFPVTNGDMLIISGDFENADGDIIRFENPIYITFKGDMVKFHKEDPRTAE